MENKANIQFPVAFADRMRTYLGSEWQKFVDVHQSPSPVSIRLNPLKKKDSENLTRVPWCNAGFYLEKRPHFTLDPLFHAGAYYVQEASSMFIEQGILQHLNIDDSIRVLDLSAAPGGKSTLLLSLLNNRGLLVSNEVIRSRASILSENIQKWGFPNVLITNNDPSDFSALEGFFDIILVDAPCSGEGLFRKDPQAMTEWSQENVSLCAARQSRILEDVWPSLKENGVLIYSTCTYNESENENNLLAFSSKHQVGFLEIKTDPSWNIIETKKENVIGYRFMPHKVNGEGFFLSVMKKLESAESRTGKIKPRLTRSNKAITEKLSSWILNADQYSFFQHQDLVFALPKKTERDIEYLLNHLRFVYAGTNIATLKHDKAIPEHALALSVMLNRDHHQHADVDESAALEYLKRGTIVLQEDTPKGFTLITYKNTPLGWVNNLGNRVNNLYPQEWRIRMDIKN